MIVSNKIEDFKGSKPTVTIGFFDGVHLGHQEILKMVTQQAKEKNTKSLVITFWPHPRIALNNDSESLRFLTTINEKKELIKGSGVDGLLIMDFTPELASTSAIDFLQNFLIETLHVSAIVLGYNHAFGNKGQGNFNLIKEHTKDGNYKAIQVNPVKIGDVEISSSKIRLAIESGDIKQTKSMLGRPYALTGTIEGGQQIGRSIGYPTANIKPNDNLKIVPGEGVYAVWVDYYKNSYPAMLNIGTRPTIGNGLRRTIEAHIIGFKHNIYDQEITVRFIEKIRDELKFPTLDELKDQLAKDKVDALKVLDIS